MKNIHILPTENSSRISYSKDGVLELHRLQWRKGTQNMYITSDEKIKEKDWFFRKSYAFGQHNGAEILLSKDDRKIILTTDQDLIKDGVQAIDDEFLEWFVKNPSCEEVEIEDISMQYHEEGYYEYKIIIPKEDWLLNNPQCKQIESCSKSLSKKCICTKEEPTLANMRCTCMSFDPNCFTGSCRKCGFLPKEEPKQHLIDMMKADEELGLYDESKQETLEEYTSQDFLNEVCWNNPKQETLEEVAKRYATDMSGTYYEDLYNAFINGAKWKQEQDKNKYSEEDMKEAFKNGAFKWRMHSGGKCFEEWFEQFKNK